MADLRAAYEHAVLRFQQACATLAGSARINWWRGWHADPMDHSRNAGAVAIAEMELIGAAFGFAVERMKTETGPARIEAAADATIAKAHHDRSMAEDEHAKLRRWKDLYRDEVLKKVRWSPYQP